MKCFGSASKPHRCKIILLDETELIQEIQSSHRGQDILEIVFKHLNLLETVYFGLRFINTKGYSCWLDAKGNVVKQVKGIEVPITFYFGVRFYASDPCKLLEEATRYQFFLQLKADIQVSRLAVTNELAAQLLAFIIQSELGDYDPRVHQHAPHNLVNGSNGSGSYISEFRLINGPIANSPDFEAKVCELHKALIGQIPAAVEMQFLERLKWLDLYGCELHPVIAEDANEYFIGLSPHGIVVLKNKLKVANYFWPRIVKIMRKSKYFMIRVIDKESEENTYGFEMANKEASKAIHRSCKEHQEFFKLSQSTAAANAFNSRRGTLNKSLTKQNGSLANGSQLGPSSLTESSANLHHRPAPTLVRVPSRRYQRMGLPDGCSEKGGFGKREVTGAFENGAFSNGMSRHNSTPSLLKNGLQTRYTTSPYHVTTTYEQSLMGTKHERGLFSKSASASPLSVRSAFVSRYDYGSTSTPYISPMKRHTSSLSLQRNGHSHPQQPQMIITPSNGHHPHHHHHRRSHLSDNESEVSKCSRASKHSTRSRNCRHEKSELDSGTESDSSRKRRHRHRKHRSQMEQPQLVAWTDVSLVEKKMSRPEVSNGSGYYPLPATAKQSSAVVRNLNTYTYGDSEEMMTRNGSGRPQTKVNGHPNRNSNSNGFLSSEMKRYITHDPVESTHLSELEKRDIKYTNVESDSKFYKVRPSTNGSSANYRPLAQQEKTSSGGDSYAYNSANSTNQPLTRYRLDYDRNQPQLSSADANFDKGDRSLPYFADRSNYSAYDGGGGGGHYLDYLGKSQSLAQVSINGGNFHQSQAVTPRVHFQTPHTTTAYFNSNHDVFMGANSGQGATLANGNNKVDAHIPLAARKTHEMSTEL